MVWQFSDASMKSKRKKRVLEDGIFKDLRTQDVESKAKQRKARTGQIKDQFLNYYSIKTNPNKKER